MNLANLWAEIEHEHAWRIDELRFFQNQIAKIPNESDRKVYRKALILLLYAHFEGFCKFALAHYVRAVNAEGLTCHSVNFALAAATLSKMLAELRNPNKKAREFKKSLPADEKLHRFRDREFVEVSSRFESKPVEIPDDVIDTESNLKPIVLRKNLYRVGLEHDKFAHLEGRINKLLEFRNNIAHGSPVAGIESKEYDSLRSDVGFIINQIKRDVMLSLHVKAYLRT